jgi:hypothetical protein
MPQITDMNKNKKIVFDCPNVSSLFMSLNSDTKSETAPIESPINQFDKASNLSKAYFANSLVSELCFRKNFLQLSNGLSSIIYRC